MFSGEKTFITLGIETSCDDTSVALVHSDGRVLLQKMASQTKGHLPFGGVVPEVASRMHLEALIPLVDQVLKESGIPWEDISLVSVSSRPGLLGSLLVGVVSAKTLALGLQKELVGVNHIHGHIFSPFLREDGEGEVPLKFPFLSLVVSGGHTHLYLVKSFLEIQELGRTRDDAAGEAFDKFANLLRLGFPGGPLVDKMAQGGNPKAFDFPKAMINRPGYEFSFSGLKASAARCIDGLSKPLSDSLVKDLCASFQESVCEVLIHQLAKAAKDFQISQVSIAGGVSANSRLRAGALKWAQENGKELFIPPMKFCTDNAAMIAFVGARRRRAGEVSDQTLTPSSSALDKDFV